MLEHNGKQYARVTEVLTKESDLFGIDPEVLANKARIGSNVHQGICDFVHGEPPILGRDEIGYFTSFKKWMNDARPTFIESEARHYDDEKMITGCVDAVIQFHGIGPRILIDYKTSAQVNAPYWNKQAHLYRHLLVGAGKPIAPTFLFLKLNKYGELPEVVRFTYDVNIMKECLRLVDNFWLTHDLIIKNGEK